MMNVFNLLTSAITYQSIIQFNMTSKFPLEAFSRRTLEVRVLGFPRRRQYKPSWVWLTTICCSLDVHGCRLWHQSKLNLLSSQTDIFKQSSAEPEPLSHLPFAIYTISNFTFTFHDTEFSNGSKLDTGPTKSNCFRYSQIRW